MRRTWWGFAGTVGVVTAAVALGCSTTGDERSAGAIATTNLAATFAPLVNLHPREQWLPIAADDFLDSSTLRWRDDDCGGEALAAGRTASGTGLPALDPARLGGRRPPYRHRPGRIPGCRRGRAFSTSGYTRPFDPLRANDIAPDEGFFLDLADRLRRTAAPAGNAIESPTYVARRTTRYRGGSAVQLTYWLLFRLDRLPGPPATTAISAHEGDWERVRVIVRRVDGGYTPLAVRYGEGGKVPWAAVSRVRGRGPRRTHPLVFAARGSHTLAARPARTAVGDRIAWRTWRDLRDAEREPWYGYGGGWGEALGQRTAVSGLGPSRWPDDPRPPTLGEGNDPLRPDDAGI